MYFWRFICRILRQCHQCLRNSTNPKLGQCHHRLPHSHNHQGSESIPRASQFYGRFIPIAFHVMALLNQVLAGKASKLAWGMVQQAAFDHGKRALATGTTLAFPHPDGSLSITIDASDMAISNILQTDHGDSTRSLAFISNRHFSPHSGITAPLTVNSSLPLRQYVISGRRSWVPYSTYTQMIGISYY